VQDDFTILCVFRSTQGLGSGNLFWQGAGLVNGEVSGSTTDFGTCLFANGQISAGTGNPDVSANSVAGYNDGNPHLLTFKRVKNSGEVDLYVDGSFAGTTTGNTNSLIAPARLALGAQQTGNNFLNGDIAEVKIFGTALSDAGRAIEENSLECKYGISAAAQTLAAPTSLSGFWGNRQISLSWVGVSGAASYNLTSATSPGGPFNLVAAGITATSFVDTSAVVGQTNYYQLTAVSACNSSAAATSAGILLPKPELNIALAAPDSVAVSWPAWASDWNLFYTLDVTPPITWTQATNAAMNTNNQLTVTLPASNGASFFRLVAP